MKLLIKGAEAEIFETDFFGEKAVLKKRTSKSYRVKELDAKIISERTKQECSLISRAKSAGVATPFLFYADKKTGEILMEMVKGKKIKELSGKNFIKACKMIGQNVGLLHKAGIIHGDLTTGNILLCKKNLAFVDFGLGFVSNREEDMAVDLLVLKRTLKAVHYKTINAFEEVEKGYRQTAKKANAVIERISEIEKRARYS